MACSSSLVPMDKDNIALHLSTVLEHLKQEEVEQLGLNMDVEEILNGGEEDSKIKTDILENIKIKEESDNEIMEETMIVEEKDITLRNLSDHNVNRVQLEPVDIEANCLGKPLSHSDIENQPYKCSTAFKNTDENSSSSETEQDEVITRVQKDVLIDFLLCHPNMVATKYIPKFTANESKRLWSELVELLENSSRSSQRRRSVEEWKEVWAELKRGVREKLALINKNSDTTDNNKAVDELNCFEKKILCIINAKSDLSLGSSQLYWEPFTAETDSNPQTETSVHKSIQVDNIDTERWQNIQTVDVSVGTEDLQRRYNKKKLDYQKYIQAYFFKYIKRRNKKRELSSRKMVSSARKIAIAAESIAGTFQELKSVIQLLLKE